MDAKTEQFEQIVQETNEAEWKKLLWRTQRWNNADTVLAILPTNERE